MKMKAKLVASFLMAGIVLGTSTGYVSEMPAAMAAAKTTEGTEMKTAENKNPFGLVYRGAIEKNEPTASRSPPISTFRRAMTRRTARLTPP